MTKGAAKMKCRKCGGTINVVASYHRQSPGPILLTRRRNCTSCGDRFTTYELRKDDFLKLEDHLRAFRELVEALSTAMEEIEDEGQGPG